MLLFTQLNFRYVMKRETNCWVTSDMVGKSLVKGILLLVHWLDWGDYSFNADEFVILTLSLKKKIKTCFSIETNEFITDAAFQKTAPRNIVRSIFHRATRQTVMWYTLAFQLFSHEHLKPLQRVWELNLRSTQPTRNMFLYLGQIYVTFGRFIYKNIQALWLR